MGRSDAGPPERSGAGRQRSDLGRAEGAGAGSGLDGLVQLRVNALQLRDLVAQLDVEGV